jgi:DNA-binding response OmpR family regulator
MATASVRVLLVEDDHDDARLVNDLLSDAKRARFIVDTVDTAEAAKAKVKKSRYNVVLLDYRLPDSTGLMFTQWLADNHFRVPVVLVTSFGDTRLQAEALDAGVCEYLEKGSFNADVLERTLMYAIGLHDRQTHDSGSGVGILIQELVGLTRESVAAQTKTASEMAELRQDIDEGMKDIRSDIDSVKTHADEKIEGVLKEVKKGPWEKAKAVLDWGVAHPWAAVFIILMLALLVTLAVLLINVLDAEKIQQLKGAVGFLLPVTGGLGDESDA